MKNLTYYIGLSLLAFGMSACGDSEDLASEYHNDNLAVYFTAGVARVQSRADASSYLPKDITVGISSGADFVTYKTEDDEGNLTPSRTDFLRWPTSTTSSLSIQAYSPVTEGSSISSFSIPADQSTEALKEAADYKTFVGEVQRQSGSNKVSFQLEHRLSQVNITISAVDERYTDAAYTFDITVYSPSTGVTLTEGNTPTVSGDGTPLSITPFQGTGITQGGTASAIIAPSEASTDEAFIAVQVKKNGEAVGAPLKAYGHQAFQSGYSYSVGLTIHNSLYVSSVQVTEWEETSAIEGTEDAKEGYIINLENYSSESDIYNALNALSNQVDPMPEIKFEGKIGDMLLEKMFHSGEDYIPLVAVDLSAISDLTTIDRDAFLDIKTLVSISAPQVTTLKQDAFYGCEALESVNLESVEEIDYYVFEECYSLQSISLPKLKNLSESAFNRCTALKSVNLESVTEMDKYGCTFLGCTSLESISLPNLQNLSEDVFYDCTALTYLYIPKVTTLDWVKVFFNCVTEQIDLTICGDKESVTWKYDGHYVSSWEIKDDKTLTIYYYGGSAEITFKSITFVDEQS